MTPRLRIVPPAAPHAAADAQAPCLVFIAGAREAVALATAQLGLGADLSTEPVRITCTVHDLACLAEQLAPLDVALAAAIRRATGPVHAWRTRTGAIPLDRPQIMGIVNLTDDSFSGDGVGTDPSAATRRADGLRAAGASLIDIGAESARADRPSLPAVDEARLIDAAVHQLVREGHRVSADTYKPEVAEVALNAGAEIVNDISGLTLGTATPALAAAAGAGYVLNYSFSVPKRRPPRPPKYADVVAETVAWMEMRLATLAEMGVQRDTIAIDPGVAFGKSHDEDLQILRRIGELTTFGQPILLAHSRKNFIGSVTGTDPANRDLETHILSAAAYGQGVRIFRVHDAAGARRALEIATALAATPGAFAPDGQSWPWKAGVAASHMTRGGANKPAPAGQRW